MATRNRRIALTLPAPLLASLSYVALRMGTNKSDLVATLLSQPVEAMRAALFAFPDPLDRLSEEDKEQLKVALRGMVEAGVAGLSEDVDREVGHG
jgi:hypothetical protein